MGASFRVIDLRAGREPVEVEVDASSPEEAGMKVFGEKLVRSGSRKHCWAKVYYQFAGQPPCMIRLYRPIKQAPSTPASPQ
jgi:hypothetical protein